MKHRYGGRAMKAGTVVQGGFAEISQFAILQRLRRRLPRCLFRDPNDRSNKPPGLLGHVAATRRIRDLAPQNRCRGRNDVNLPWLSIRRLALSEQFTSSNTLRMRGRGKKLAPRVLGARPDCLLSSLFSAAPDQARPTPMGLLAELE
jgi:hypothetical protein